MAIKYLSGNRVTALSTDLVTVTPQGYAGGNATSSTQSAGGGGAGGTATGSGNKNGGIGKVNPIVGSTHGESSGGSYYLAGGGGGAGEASGTSTGGLGGGGNGGTTGTASTQATSGYGGGAGGAGNSGTNYPNGASGVVILKLLTSSSFSSSNATSSTTGSYTILTYTSTSSSSFTISSGTADVQYLVVAGGGASKDNWGYAGGGGAGGFITGTKTALASGTYTVTVGAGGVGAGASTTPANGGNSVFSDITSLGGGGAGSWIVNSGTGFDGGSGGGAQGNSGGNDVGGSGATYSTPKLGTTDATATYPTSGVLPTGSTTTDWTLTDTTISNSALNFDSAQASTQNDGVYDLGSALSNTKWVVRFKYTIANLTNGNQSNINAYLGLFSGTGSFATNQNYMGLSYYTTSSTNYFWASASPSSNSTIWESSSTGRIYDGSVSATTYYVEIKRTSASTGEISIGTNSDFVTGRTTQTTFYGSISSSITGLRYIGIKNRSNVPTLGSAVFNGTVSDIEVYDGITAITTDSAVTVPNGSVVEETNTGKHKIWNSTTSAWVEIS